MPRGNDCCEPTSRLPGTAQAVVNEVIDAGAGVYTVRLLGLILLATANLPSQLTYSAGESVVVTQLGASTEYLIIGSIE